MGDYGKFKYLFRLLKSKEGRKVVLIPLIIMIVFSGYEIYQMEFNSKPEITEMQDGSGDIKLSKSWLPSNCQKRPGRSEISSGRMRR